MTIDDDKLKITARETFIQYLHSKKLRKTPERYAILDKIFDIEEHFSIESLYEALEKERFHVSLATVYNTIELLIDCGLLRKHLFDNKSAQYERIPGVMNHHHLICTQCGKIKEVRDPEFINLFNAKRYSTFHTSYFALYVYGICSKCYRQNRKKAKEEKLAMEQAKQSAQAKGKKSSAKAAAKPEKKASRKQAKK